MLGMLMKKKIWRTNVKLYLYCRKVEYIKVYDRKINVSKTAFAKLVANFEQLFTLLCSEGPLGDKGVEERVYLTLVQIAMVSEMEKTGEKYLTIGHEKRAADSDGEIDPSKTINLSRAEAEEFRRSIPFLMEVLEKHDWDCERYCDGAHGRDEKPHVKGFAVVQDVEGCEVVQAMFVSAPDAEEFLAVQQDGIYKKYVKEKLLERPLRSAVLAKVLMEEIDHEATLQDCKPCHELFRNLNRSRVKYLTHKALSLLEYQKPIFADELLDAFVYCGGVDTLFDGDTGELKLQVTEDPDLDKLLKVTYEVVVPLYG